MTTRVPMTQLDTTESLSLDDEFLVLDKSDPNNPQNKVATLATVRDVVSTVANVIAVDSIVDLLALPAGARRGDLRYLVKGYHAGSDVGGGEFYWDDTSTATANGVTIYAVAGVSIGRFFRKVGDFVDVRWAGVIGDGSDEIGGLYAALNASAAHNTGLDIAGLRVYFSGDLEFPSFPAASPRFVRSGRLTEISGSGKVVLGVVSGCIYEALTIDAVVEDIGSRSCTMDRVVFRLGYVPSGAGRDVLWNTYINCEFGFGLTSGISIDFRTTLGNPFNSNTFVTCKMRGGPGLICMDSTNAVSAVRGNQFISCDMSAVGSDTTIMRHGPEFSGNVFTGGYYEGGGTLDFENSGYGNSFFGARLDNSRIKGIEKFNHFEGSDRGRIYFAHTSLNGSTIYPTRPRTTYGGSIVGWEKYSNLGVENDSVAPTGFSGENALKMSDAGGSSRKGIFVSVPSAKHKDAIVSVVARVYVPSSYVGYSPELRVGNSIYHNITDRDKWVIVSASAKASSADYPSGLPVELLLSRLDSNAANYMYLDWIVVSVGGIASIYDEANADHHASGDLLQHYGDFQVFECGWDKSRLLLGDNRIWVDSKGSVRTNNSDPSNEQDGFPVSPPVWKRKYYFDAIVDQGEKIRISFSGGSGRTSAMIKVVVASSHVTSNLDNAHCFTEFAFRAKTLAGGATTMLGLKDIASYGFDPTSGVAFVSNNDGTWHMEIDNISGAYNGIQHTLEIEVQNGARSSPQLYHYSSPVITIVPAP